MGFGATVSRQSVAFDKWVILEGGDLVICLDRPWTTQLSDTKQPGCPALSSAIGPIPGNR